MPQLSHQEGTPKASLTWGFLEGLHFIVHHSKPFLLTIGDHWMSFYHGISLNPWSPIVFLLRGFSWKVTLASPKDHTLIEPFHCMSRPCLTLNPNITHQSQVMDFGSFDSKHSSFLNISKPEIILPSGLSWRALVLLLKQVTYYLSLSFEWGLEITLRNIIDLIILVISTIPGLLPSVKVCKEQGTSTEVTMGPCPVVATWSS